MHDHGRQSQGRAAPVLAENGAEAPEVHATVLLRPLLGVHQFLQHVGSHQPAELLRLCQALLQR